MPNPHAHLSPVDHHLQQRIDHLAWLRLDTRSLWAVVADWDDHSAQLLVAAVRRAQQRY